MEKIVVFGEKELKLKSSVASFRRYKQEFREEFTEVFTKLLAIKEFPEFALIESASEEDFTKFSPEFMNKFFELREPVENATYILAKTAEPNNPKNLDIVTFLEQFENEGENGITFFAQMIQPVIDMFMQQHDLAVKKNLI